MEITFSSKEELFLRVKPALKAKKKELERMGFSYIGEVDIWNFLTKTKWIYAKDLTLSDVVSDIMNESGEAIDCYLKKEHQKRSQSNNRLEII